jgi:hypothetical protein
MNSVISAMRQFPALARAGGTGGARVQWDVLYGDNRLVGVA